MASKRLASRQSSLKDLRPEAPSAVAKRLRLSASRGTAATVDGCSVTADGLVTNEHVLLSRSRFVTRLQSFGRHPTQWRPSHPLSPLEAARHGYQLMGEGDDHLLRCVSCRALIYAKMPSATLVAKTTRNKALADLKARLVSKHRDGCVWQLCQTPSSFAKINVDDYTLDYFEQTLMKLTREVDTQVPRIKVSDYQQVLDGALLDKMVNKVMEKYETNDVSVVKNAMVLTLCGWIMGSKKGLKCIECTFCGRLCGLWNYVCHEDEELVEEERGQEQGTQQGELQCEPQPPEEGLQGSNEHQPAVRGELLNDNVVMTQHLLCELIEQVVKTGFERTVPNGAGTAVQITEEVDVNLFQVRNLEENERVGSENNDEMMRPTGPEEKVDGGNSITREALMNTANIKTIDLSTPPAWQSKVHTDTPFHFDLGTNGSQTTVNQTQVPGACQKTQKVASDVEVIESKVDQLENAPDHPKSEDEIVCEESKECREAQSNRKSHPESHEHQPEGEDRPESEEVEEENDDDGSDEHQKTVIVEEDEEEEEGEVVIEGDEGVEYEELVEEEEEEAVEEEGSEEEQTFEEEYEEDREALDDEGEEEEEEYHTCLESFIVNQMDDSQGDEDEEEPEVHNLTATTDSDEVVILSSDDEDNRGNEYGEDSTNEPNDEVSLVDVEEKLDPNLNVDGLIDLPRKAIFNPLRHHMAWCSWSHVDDATPRMLQRRLGRLYGLLEDNEHSSREDRVQRMLESLRGVHQ